MSERVFKDMDIAKMRIKWWHHLFLWLYCTNYMVVKEENIMIKYKVIGKTIFYLDIKELT